MDSVESTDFVKYFCKKSESDEEMKRICFMTTLYTSRQQWCTSTCLAKEYHLYTSYSCTYWSVSTCGHQNQKLMWTIFSPVSVPFWPIIDIIGSWQYVHMKEQVLSFKTNGHLWKSVKNWLQKWGKSKAISKHVTFSHVDLKGLFTLGDEDKVDLRQISRFCSHWATVKIFHFGNVFVCFAPNSVPEKYMWLCLVSICYIFVWEI